MARKGILNNMIYGLCWYYHKDISRAFSVIVFFFHAVAKYLDGTRTAEHATSRSMMSKIFHKQILQQTGVKWMPEAHNISQSSCRFSEFPI